MTHIFHIASGDLWAGAEVQLFQLVTRMARTPDVRLLVVLLNHGLLASRLKDAGVEVVVIDERQHGGLGILRQLIVLMRQRRPDVVHTHRRKENVLGSIAALFIPGVILVRTVHGSAEIRPPWWQIHQRAYSLLDAISGRVLFDAIVAVSAELARSLTRYFPAKKIITIENGIDVEQTQQAGSRPVHLPGPASAIKVGIVGRLVPVKRIDLFLDVAKSTIRELPDRFSFHVFGDGPLHDQLIEQARALQIVNQVHFAGFEPNLPAYLAQLDILLITSDHEGLPMILLEAMALSVPVVAHAVGGIPQVLDSGASGTLVTAHTPDAYASTLRYFAGNRENFREKAARALQTVKSRYSTDRCAADYLKLYKTLAGFPLAS